MSEVCKNCRTYDTILEADDYCIYCSNANVADLIAVIADLAHEKEALLEIIEELTELGIYYPLLLKIEKLADHGRKTK